MMTRRYGVLCIEVVEEKEGHDVIELYGTGLGGVQSKCCRQTYGVDELCGGTVIEVGVYWKMLVEIECNELQV